MFLTSPASSLSSKVTFELITFVSALVVHHLDGCLVDVHADDALKAVVVHLFRQSRHATADIEYQVGLSNRHRQDIFDAHPSLVPVEVVFDSASVDPTRCTCSPKTFRPSTSPLLFSLQMFNNNYIHAVACRLPNVVLSSSSQCNLKKVRLFLDIHRERRIVAL